MNKPFYTFKNNIACGKSLTEDEVLMLMYLEHEVFLYLHKDREIYLSGWVTMNEEKKPIFTPSFVPDWYKGPVPIELEMEKITHLEKLKRLYVCYKGREWAPKKEKVDLCVTGKDPSGDKLNTYTWTKVGIQELKELIPHGDEIEFTIGESDDYFRAQFLWDGDKMSFKLGHEKYNYELPDELEFDLDLVWCISKYSGGCYHIALEFDYFYEKGIV